MELTAKGLTVSQLIARLCQFFAEEETMAFCDYLENTFDEEFEEVEQESEGKL